MTMTFVSPSYNKSLTYPNSPVVSILGSIHHEVKADASKNATRHGVHVTVIPKTINRKGPRTQITGVEGQNTISNTVVLGLPITWVLGPLGSGSCVVDSRLIGHAGGKQSKEP